MQYITGRIVIVGEEKIIKKDNSSFSSVILLIKKKMNGKMRNIAFECFGKIAKKVLQMRIDDKVEVKYFIHSHQPKNTSLESMKNYWFTILQAKDVEKVVVEKSSNNNELNLH